MIATREAEPRFTEIPAANGRGRRWLRRIGDAWNANSSFIAIGVLIAAFLAVFFWRSMFISIHPGQAAVHWSRFNGTEMDRVFTEGMVVIPPWDEMIVYDTRLQQRTDSLKLLTVNGLTLDVVVSTRYRPVLRELPALHRQVGPEYAAKVIFPEVVGALRRVIGNYTPDQIYAKDEYALLAEINDLVRAEIDPHLFHVDEVLILSLKLPASLGDAIVTKLTQEQTALAYVYRLAREESEARRKRVEAQGISDFERISGISMLRWRGLDVTEQLAKSENSKLIVIPTGSEGLPLILNPGN